MELTPFHLRGVSYRVGGRRILDKISAAIPARRLTGLLGPNGAGKTTLLRLLAGLRRPAEGRIELEGRDLTEWSSADRARRIAVVPQSPAVGFGFTVEEVVAMGRHPFLKRLQPLTARCRRVVAEAMEATRTLELRERLITELSGGEQQRVFLARALAQEPDIMLLDEPTANLDVRFQLEVFSLIKGLQRERGLTVVVALHDLTWALRYCDHILVLNAGRLEAAGTPGQVLTPALVEKVFGVRAQTVEGSFGALVDVGPL
ncbi:MAG: ABC transporter ATP-binding protein [Firmicutes bacterium]|nr:ABC transporter ATP-binding protein [Bacillota bacterium]